MRQSPFSLADYGESLFAFFMYQVRVYQNWGLVKDQQLLWHVSNDFIYMLTIFSFQNTLCVHFPGDCGSETRTEPLFGDRNISGKSIAIFTLWQPCRSSGKWIFIYFLLNRPVQQVNDNGNFCGCVSFHKNSARNKEKYNSGCKKLV